LHETKTQEESNCADQIISEKVVFATRFGIVQNPNQYGQKEKVDAKSDQEAIEVFAEPSDTVWGNCFFEGE
jgi:hypothetical protein